MEQPRGIRPGRALPLGASGSSGQRTQAADFSISVAEGVEPFPVRGCLVEPVGEAVLAYMMRWMQFGPDIEVDAAAVRRDGEVMVLRMGKIVEDFETLDGAQQQRVQAVLSRHLMNRMYFYCELAHRLHIDLVTGNLKEGFNLELTDVHRVVLTPFFADPHNGAKGPVRIDIYKGDDERVSLVYKPRTMHFEGAVHDPHTSIIQVFNSKQRQRHELDPSCPYFQLGTYPVFARSGEPIGYGYAGFVEGAPVLDELVEPSMGSVGAYWQLVGEGESSTQSFFSSRTRGELAEDYLLFLLLSQVGARDTHPGNFILKPARLADNPEHQLVLIDLECLDDNWLTGPAEWEDLIFSATLQLHINDDEPVEAASAYLDEVARNQQDWAEAVDFFKSSLQPLHGVRYVPLTTDTFYVMRRLYLATHIFGRMDAASENEQFGELYNTLLLAIHQKGFVLDDSDDFGNKLVEVFEDFDIPYFTVKEGILYLGRYRVGIRRT